MNIDSINIVGDGFNGIDTIQWNLAVWSPRVCFGEPPNSLVQNNISSYCYGFGLASGKVLDVGNIL